MTHKWSVTLLAVLWVLCRPGWQALYPEIGSRTGEVLAQTTLPQEDPYAYYYRLMQISGQTTGAASLLIRPVVIPGEINSRHPWERQIARSDNELRRGRPLTAEWYDPVWVTSYNSRLPRGGNDGVLWQGRGFNTAFSTGAAFGLGPLHLRLRPVFAWSANREFDLTPYSKRGASKFSYPLRRHDYVQRFGDDPYQQIDPGESMLELRLSAFAVAAGHGRQWTGPAVTYPLLFSYNAPGFWHGRIGTWRPFETPAGDFEFRYLFGALEYSDYYREKLTGELRSVNHLATSWSPPFAPGLYLGFQRMFIQDYPDDLSDLIFFSGIFQPLEKDKLAAKDEEGDGSDPDNQMITVFARWEFSDAGFEVYGEFGRNDHNQNLRDFRMHPDHARAWLLGLTKTFEPGFQGLLALNAELSQLEDSRTSLARTGPIPKRGSSVPWYANGDNSFTHRGQIMGSPMGTAGNAQMVRLDYYDFPGRIGFRVERRLYNNSLIHRNFNRIAGAQPDEPGLEPRDVRQAELLLALETSLFFPRQNLEIDAVIESSRVFNHNYLYRNDMTNLRFMLTLRRHIDGWLR